MKKATVRTKTGKNWVSQEFSMFLLRGGEIFFRTLHKIFRMIVSYVFDKARHPRRRVRNADDESSDRVISFSQVKGIRVS